MRVAGSTRAPWSLLATGLALTLLAAASSSPTEAGDNQNPVPALVVTSGVGWEPDVQMTQFFPNPAPSVQAVGSTHQPRDRQATDRNAYLLNASALIVGAPGYEVLNPRLGRHYGTYELVELIQQVGATFAEQHPDHAFLVGDLSKRRGGTIRDGSGRRIHSSHRNGLDADIMYLHRNCKGDGRVDHVDCPIDVAANLELMRMFVEGGPSDERSMVDVFFVGRSFQRSACRHVRRAPAAVRRRHREVLRRSQLKGGHQAHFHLRIACPESSRRCPSPRRHRPRLCR